MCNSNLEIKRGEIWLGNLNDTKKEHTSKQMGIRPLLIIQNDVGNKYSPTVIVAVITGQSKRQLPTHVNIGVDSGLNRPSSILLEQIFTIDKTDLINRLGKANNKIMEEVDRALMTSGGINIDKFVSEKPLFDLSKAREFVEGIEELDEYIINLNSNKSINGLLRSRDILILNLKEYCRSYKIEYTKFYNDVLVNTQIENARYNKGDVRFGVSV